MIYKGYTGKIADIDSETGVIYGKVVGIVGAITFEAETGKDLIREFHTSVDSHLAWCAKRKIKPPKPYSGKFLTRLPRSLHRDAVVKAAESGMSLNDLVKSALQATVSALVKPRAKSNKVTDKPAPTRPKKPIGA